MSVGCCEHCKKEERCSKYIGMVYGFCNIDYEPEEKEEDHGSES